MVQGSCVCRTLSVSVAAPWFPMPATPTTETWTRTVVSASRYTGSGFVLDEGDAEVVAAPLAPTTSWGLLRCRATPLAFHTGVTYHWHVESPEKEARTGRDLLGGLCGWMHCLQLFCLDSFAASVHGQDWWLALAWNPLVVALLQRWANWSSVAMRFRAVLHGAVLRQLLAVYGGIWVTLRALSFV